MVQENLDSEVDLEEKRQAKKLVLEVLLFNSCINVKNNNYLDAMTNINQARKIMYELGYIEEIRYIDKLVSIIKEGQELLVGIYREKRDMEERLTNLINSNKRQHKKE